MFMSQTGGCQLLKYIQQTPSPEMEYDYVCDWIKKKKKVKMSLVQLRIAF